MLQFLDFGWDFNFSSMIGENSKHGMIILFLLLVCWKLNSQHLSNANLNFIGSNNADIAIQNFYDENAIPDKDEKVKFKQKLKWSAEIMSFMRTRGFADKFRTVNPMNRVARLNNFDAGLYFRPEIRYNLSRKKTFLKCWIKPRLNIDFDFDTNAKFGDETLNAAFFFQEFRVKWQLESNLNLTAGRYVKQLGTSNFINPSNPFLLNPGALNPKLEQDPMGFIELNYSTANELDISFIANIAKGRNREYDDMFFEFHEDYALQFEYYWSSVNAGAIAALSRRDRFHFGGFVQSNVNEAMVLYGEFSLVYNPNRFYPVAGHSKYPAMEYEMVNGVENEKVFPSILLGGSYTFNFGPTLSFEYFYNGMGYKSNEVSKFLEQIDWSSTSPLMPANLNLARSINPGLLYLGRRYFFTQISQTGLFDEFDYSLRMVNSLDRGGVQFSALLEWDIGTFEIFSVLFVNTGKRDFDLNRLVDYSFMYGLIYKL